MSDDKTRDWQPQPAPADEPTTDGSTTTVQPQADQPVAEPQPPVEPQPPAWAPPTPPAPGPWQAPGGPAASPPGPWQPQQPGAWQAPASTPPGPATWQPQPGPAAWQQPGATPPPPGMWQPQAGGPPPGPGQWQSPAGGYWPAAQPRKGGNRTVLIVVGVVVVLVVLVIVIAAALIGGGLGSLGNRTQLTDLSVGQCIDGIKASDFTGEDPQVSVAAILGVTVIDCAEPHEGELIGRAFWTGGGSTFPGDTTMEGFAIDSCRDLFEDYVGLSFDLSVYNMTYFYPQLSSWNEGQRSVECIAHPPTGTDKETGSVRNSNR